MSEPLLFFGAGASAPFEIPTMKEMVALFKQELSAEKTEGIDAEVALYTVVEDVLRKDFERVDLESVFSVIDGIAQGLTPRQLGYLTTFFVRRAKDPSLLEPLPLGLKTAAQRLRNKFEDFVKRVCWTKPDKLDSILRTYLPFFDKVFQSQGGQTSVFQFENQSYRYNPGWEMFTTNYDNVLEVLWRDGIRQYELETGFQWNTASHTQVLNSSRLLGEKLKLVKLHGSITWWVEEPTGTIVEDRQPPNPSYLARKLGEQVLLYPIQQKEMLAPPYLDLFYAFKESLQRHNKWLVVGYSFADEMLRDLFVRSSTPRTRLVIVHPDATVSRRLEQEPGWRGKILPVLNKFGGISANTLIHDALQTP
jgi:hypothetical protein